MENACTFQKIKNRQDCGFSLRISRRNAAMPVPGI
jgi:hypothetical protein